METENVLVETIVQSWKHAVRRADEVFLELSDEQLELQVSPGQNRIYYLLGHLAAVHDRALPILGGYERMYPELDINFIDSVDCATYDLELNESLKASWTAINDAITYSCEKLSPAEWVEHQAEQPVAGLRLAPRLNRLAILLSLLNHLSYHLGQIQLVLQGAGDVPVLRCGT
jgi:uncharacterized damage-inducible protein DinB